MSANASFHNAMSVSIAERNADGLVYDVSISTGGDRTTMHMDSVAAMVKLARMVGVPTIIIESNSTLRYDVNGTDLAAHFETEIITQGATRRGRKYNPEICVTAVLR